MNITEIDQTNNRLLLEHRLWSAYLDTMTAKNKSVLAYYNNYIAILSSQAEHLLNIRFFSTILHNNIKNCKLLKDHGCAAYVLHGACPAKKSTP